MSRLSEDEVSEVWLDRPRAERALGELLRLLGLPRRPVRWAGGPSEAYWLSASLKSRMVGDEVVREAEKAARRAGESPRHAKTDDAAFKAATRALHGVWESLSLGVLRTLGGEKDEDYHWPRARAVDRLWGLRRKSFPDAWWWAGEFVKAHATGRYEEGSVASAAVKTPLLDAYAAGLLAYWVADEAVLALPRPALRLRRGLLHGDGAPAVVWESQCLHFLNGVPVPEEFALTPARELDCRLILRTSNAEVRRELVRKMGVERVVTELGAVCTDREGDYELLMFGLGDGRWRPFLKMKNPSVPGVIHIEGVHPNCRTVREAVAWRNGTDVPPSVLT